MKADTLDIILMYHLLKSIHTELSMYSFQHKSHPHQILMT